MRISDWSSDVCSSDLRKSIARKSLDRKFIARPSTQETTGFILNHDQRIALARAVIRWIDEVAKGLDSNGALQHYALRSSHLEAGEFWVEIRNDVSSSDRKGGGEGKSVAIRGDQGGRRIIKKKKTK